MAHENVHERPFREIRVRSSEVEVRKIHLSDLWQSLREGYDDFLAKPTFIPFLIFVYPLFALMFTLLLLGEDLLYLAFPMLAGFTLLGPVVSVGLCEMSRRRERGLETTWGAAFDFVHSYSFAPIAALSIVMMLLYVAWLFMAEFFYFGLFADNPPTSLAAFWTDLTTTQRGAALIFHGNLVGLIFAFTALAISAISFPLLLDRPANTITAIFTSVRAVTTNPFVMAVWGLTVVVLLAAGAALFLIGLGVVLPILGHATWHLYRKIVAP